MLKNSVLNENAVDTISWPNISTDPVCEYRQHSNIFSLDFPWLFFGGMDDFYDDHGEMKVTANHWTRNMLLYYDGIFACDKMFWLFCFGFYDLMKKSKQ